MSDKPTLVSVKQGNKVIAGVEILIGLAQDEDGERAYVPLKPLCDLWEVDWPRQLDRLTRDAVLSQQWRNVIFKTGPQMEEQEFLSLPHEYLRGWLLCIDANEMALASRPAFIDFQELCYWILNEVFKQANINF